MSLPPGFLDELRGRLSLSDVVGKKVMWDSRKSNPGKGDMWAPCPFHHEKTASFHVDDRKGYYYCFGCHAKGDAITFVRESENVPFIEAVEILAGEAGLAMPKRDPKAKEKADRNTQLAEVMEQALQFYRLQLSTAAGREAASYLQGRGLDDAARARWDLGFAPAGWQGLWDHLNGKAVPPDLILEAGLAKPSQKGGKPYDTFRNRIMFPIRDARGRCIAFGGRAMDPTDSAKYLNSPETPLFDKGRTLFNHGPARASAGHGDAVLVAEGYMDVIALVEAGFAGAVAPLGTAITEHQLALLWRMSPEPIIALDGDTAGQRAANRLIDLALPLLNGANSLYFLALPGGMDPDDYVKAHGAAALTQLIDDSKQPLVKALWDREFEAGPVLTPEQKAGLDKRLRAAIGQIPDQDVKRYYGEAIRTYRWEAFRPKAQPKPSWRRVWGMAEAPVPMAGTKQSALATSNPDETVLAVHLDRLHAMRERFVAALLLKHAGMIDALRDRLERLEINDPHAQQIVDSLLTAPITDELTGLFDPVSLQKVMQDPYTRIHPCLQPDADPELVAQELQDALDKITTDRAAALELQEASEDIHNADTEALTWRLGQSAKAKERAGQGNQEDSTQYDVAPSGAQVDRDEKGAFEDLLQTIRFSKPGR